ncbi:MAG: hypothetical protein LBH43_04355 [Treponema sp.]|jgi:hypothetical protein|nr:hypothetical protein [Treponema sp.]
MKNNETPEMLLNRVYNSAKTRKLAILLVLAGMVICIIPLLPFIQNILFSFVDARISRKGSSGDFESRLRSLLSLPFFGLLAFVFALCCLFSKDLAAFFEDTKNEHLIAVLTAGAGALLLVFISVFSYQHGWQWLNSDHSSEMILGKLLAQENVIVSRNWHYSTEIRLIYQTLFTMPLFKLFARHENWALIRSLGIFLNNLVLILSYLFMARQMKIQTKWICITSVFLIMPISTGYWDIVTFGGYYVFFIAQIFCCLGLFIRLAEKADTKITHLSFILFTILSFVLGMQGIRSLLCVHIPLLLVCIELKAARKRNFPLFLGCYGFIACGAGFAANYLLHFWYSFHSFENMGLVNLYTEFFPKLSQSLVCLTGFFGLSIGSSLLSARGLFSIAAIIGTILLFWTLFKSTRQAKLQNNMMAQKAEYQFMQVFFIVSAIFNIFVFIVVDEDIKDRYFIPFMVLYIPLTAILFEHTEKLYGHLKRTALVTGIVLFIFGQAYLTFQNLAGWDRNTVRKGYMQYLLDNQLGYGFANFSNANVTSELTNGRIELVGLAPDGLESGKAQFRIHNWLNPVKFSNPFYYQGESFLLLTRAEWEQAKMAGRPFAELQADYEDAFFTVKRYPSATIIHREVLDNR